MIEVPQTDTRIALAVYVDNVYFAERAKQMGIEPAFIDQGFPGDLRRIQEISYLVTDPINLDNNPHNYECIAFAFGVFQHEEWIDLSWHYADEDDPRGIDPYVQILDDIQLDTEYFLTHHGYEVVEGSIQNGDIIAYGNINSVPLADILNRRRKPTQWPTYNVNLFQALHFGMCMNGKVISKFGRGDIYEHDRDLVPSDYGNQAMIFRKVS